MNIHTLPEDLLATASAPIQLYNYHIAHTLTKNKVNLSKNTFSFLLHGTKEVFTDYEPIKLDKEQFLLIRAGNCLMTENISSANKTYRSILLFFTDEVLLDFLQNHQLETPKSKPAQPFQVFDYDSYIQNFVESLAQLNRLTPALQNEILPAKFREIMIYLVQIKGVESLHFLLGNHDDRERHFINVIERNKLNKLSLQELAFLCNMSLSSFKREFRKHYQQPPSRWFQDQRLEHAAYLLKQQKKRPIDLYEEIGYESLSNFTQAFKKKYGSTPKQFQLSNLDF
ncbi:MAG: helix-turn-helix domain-containing protein [Bacteroidia bacterium]